MSELPTFRKMVPSGEEEKGPQNVSLFNYQTGVTLHDTLHAKADRV